MKTLSLSQRLLGLSLFLSLSLLAACECEDLVPSEPLEVPLTVTVILDGAGGSADGDTFFASFEFTDTLDIATVELGTTVLVTGSVAGEISISPEFDTDRIFLSVPVGSCNTFPCGKSLTFRLVGTGDAPIRNVDGRVLDGDYDNSDGGDYVLTQEF